MLRASALVIVAIGLLAGLVALNLRPFLRAKPEIRTKELDFLPPPAVMPFLALGHRNSAQRLRWIDSFAYLQLQFDRRDDAVAGGGQGFTRLYDGLLALDERFIPVYHHAAMSVNGIAKRPHEALGYLLRGTLTNRHDYSLWQHAAAILVADFNAEERQTHSFDAFLAQWAAAMLDPNQRQAVWDWQEAMARRRFLGLTQVGYWQERLLASAPGTPLAAYIEQVLREQLARYGVDILQRIHDDRLAAAQPVATISDLVDGERLTRMRVHAGYGPVAITDAGLVLRSDPWGWPLHLEDGRVISPGIERAQCERRLVALNMEVAAIAKKTGRWPESLDEVVAAGLTLPKLPAGMDVVYAERRIELAAATPPHTPWPLRASAP